MSTIGNKIRERLELKGKAKEIAEKRKRPITKQKFQLKKLLLRAQFTQIGKDYNFAEMLTGKDSLMQFQERVPIFDYQSMYRKYWYRQLHGEMGITWPGKTKYFALSSGTSEGASKYIPVTRAMLTSIKRASLRQILSITKYDIPKNFLKTGMLAIGGSTHLNYNGRYFEGDLSGITAKGIPFWFQHFYKPGKAISQERDWNQKLKEMVDAAPSWDIGIIVGVPAWVQILLEKIIARYQLNTIHDIWPNLMFYVHSGVSIAPYKKRFNELFGKPVYFKESYLASEGYIAFAGDKDSPNMRLLLNNSIFFEFVPFTESNFDQNGNIMPQATALAIDKVENNVEYAILLTTNAGAYRYLIGDTIKFINKDMAEIIITGRTKHFLSVVGEHLSLDNMSRAIELLQKELNCDINEFTVFAQKEGSLFSHHWYLGIDKNIDPKQAAHLIDTYLSTLNDDYRVERLEALKNVYVDVVPEQKFIDYMATKGKLGGANKFPRVLRGSQIEEWEAFVKE